VKCPLSRVATILNVGDQALVVRLSYRPQDTSMKRDLSKFNPAAETWEIGLLSREE